MKMIYTLENGATQMIVANFACCTDDNSGDVLIVIAHNSYAGKKATTPTTSTVELCVWRAHFEEDSCVVSISEFKKTTIEHAKVSAMAVLNNLFVLLSVTPEFTSTVGSSVDASFNLLRCYSVKESVLKELIVATTSVPLGCTCIRELSSSNSSNNNGYFAGVIETKDESKGIFERKRNKSTTVCVWEILPSIEKVRLEVTIVVDTSMPRHFNRRSLWYQCACFWAYSFRFTMCLYMGATMCSFNSVRQCYNYCIGRF